MQKFIIKLLIFSIPIIVLYNIPKIKHYSFHNDINKKINSLIKNNKEPMIIIGGDSRAERQIIPSIIEDRLRFYFFRIKHPVYSAWVLSSFFFSRWC